jgi:hypothetical protein
MAINQRTQKLWAIKINDFLLPTSCAGTRKMCIQDFCDRLMCKRTWEQWKKHGYECSKATVTIKEGWEDAK